ncbi:sulfatase-like hydrolase/transferase [Candidatus Viridilinea mediisalina]|uniref:Sulfatase N-terminal domain-containing protein n=1 Tax=Candidatus Viridilinea mediisalina TaxID=2024553 RepID=A0A2A6RF67_9CHLR|nr:sulfatase-like hydrolase/transferase [Candidatus Viridilinea mediisalina]PDW01515.1 hypothetical protein CJ255_18780 [Candidatus Viridilinea mediisalina]
MWESLQLRIDYYDFYITTTRKGIVPWDARQITVLLFMMLGSLSLTIAYIWAALRSWWWIRLGAWFLFMVAVLYEYSYHGAMGRNSTPEDVLLVMLYQDTGLFIDAIMIFLNFDAFVPMVLFGLLLLTPLPIKTLKPQALFLVISIAAVFFSSNFHMWSKASLPFPLNSYPSTAFSSFLRTMSYTPWRMFATYSGPREVLDFPPPLHVPKNNIVFIVDESIRGDHLSVNGYERATTPYLDELAAQGFLYSWGVAVSAATCSLQANNLLLTGFHVLPDHEQAVKRWPTIFQYAQAMGYRTIYLDTSSDTLWNGTRDDLQYIDDWKNVNTFSYGEAYDFDRNMGVYLHEIISSSTGNFIWINKRGVHFQYTNAFPRDTAQWEPILELRTHDPIWRAEMVNAYDSGLYYNLEGFFRAAFPDTSIFSHTLVLYTSDHAQTLAQDGEWWSHCRNSPNEAKVPLILLGEPNQELDTSYAASHFNIFATLLDLMGIAQEQHQYDYQPSLFRVSGEQSRPRFYYVGSLEGGANARFYPFDDEAAGQ